ncbi:MAG: hypothetical protein JSW66_12280 [Phycisphaerales bacterium]|nr:MAG: hypothetical protein JSW66_12280 [Phycisphaerales bacterium]
MPVEAPVSKFRLTNLKIYIAVCIALVLWCVYDAHFNETFREKYTDADGNPTGWLVINQKAPPYFAGAAVLLAVYLFVIKNKKLVADENELVISAGKTIRYDAIQRIDKTYFKKRGFFIVTYKDERGNDVNRALSNRKYDNLGAVLDHLVAKIS